MSLPFLPSCEQKYTFLYIHLFLLYLYNYYIILLYVIIYTFYTYVYYIRIIIKNFILFRIDDPLAGLSLTIFFNSLTKNVIILFIWRVNINFIEALLPIIRVACSKYPE